MEEQAMVGFRPGNYIVDAEAARDAGAVARPTGEGDGRAASIDDTAQASWGWGADPARATRPVADAARDLETDPTAFSQREQGAVRRDLGPEIGAYADYEPRPFVGGVGSGS